MSDTPTEPPEQVIEEVAEWLSGYYYGADPDTTYRDLEDARDVLAVARDAGWQPAPTVCVCGSPSTLGTVHRTDGPCYRAEPAPTVSPDVDHIARAIAAADPRRSEAAVKAEALDEMAERLPALTEGDDRAGTAKWPERERDAYSLAIEEVQAAIRDRADRLREGGEQ